ncbi:MAG TPA: long-chain fatty acid--CoA ligase [Spirochaetota bacterium]|mgnify:CR=1 FL=1|nr:long-chain fatty acid--CoA ligase [Spirochaetota bacterium]HPJ37777.1 long-chain fatty acid--CoA ligase [Spirochaetota bacterium]
MPNTDILNLPWKEKWAWESTELKTITHHFVENTKKFANKDGQLFNPDLYHGDNNGRLSWGEVYARVEDYACGLISIGLGKQEMVAIMAASGPYWTHADMALACANGVSVTIYPTLSIKEASYIVNDSGSKFIFVRGDDVLEKILSGFDAMPKLEKIIVMDREYKSSDDRIIGMGELQEKGIEWKKDSKNYDEYIARRDGISMDDIYTILYTSGTTGQGKGVVLTHHNCTSRMYGVNEYFDYFGMGFKEEYTTLCFLPLSHIFDRGSCQATAIMCGATIAYADSPGTLLDDLQKYNPHWINCVPRLYEKIYIQLNQKMGESGLKKKLFDWALKIGEQAYEYRKDPATGTYNMAHDFDLLGKLPAGLKFKYKIADKLFAKVRALFGKNFQHSFSASASISPDLLKFFFIIGIRVLEGYGSTESFNACTNTPLTHCKPGYVGLVSNGSRARISDIGELELKGAGIFGKYLNKPEETAESFTKDGWFKTGDKVIMDEFGYVKIVDRIKAIICLSSGKNVAPAKIESLFATSPYIEQIFTIGDERSVISTLIVPSFTFFKEKFDAEGIDYDKSKIEIDNSAGVPIVCKVGEDFIEKGNIKELIAQEVAKANKELEGFEQVKQYTILTERFTEQNGMLTPTQKTKKKNILETYSDQIEKMYNR